MNTLKRLHPRALAVLLTALLMATAIGLGGRASAAKKIPLKVARIYIEFNASANDLGFHVSLDGEDWKKLKITHPKGGTVFDVTGHRGFGMLGMTELFFEGAEPPLDEVDLKVLLGLFPEGIYTFSGKYVDGVDLTGTATLSHRVPAAPEIISPSEGDMLPFNEPVVIAWEPVSKAFNPSGEDVTITGYQVIVGSFQVTLPATKTSVTVPTEFLEPHTEYLFEVLAIEASGNQTITESSFSTK